MGALPCAKEVIDGGKAAMAALGKADAALGKALGCMEASVLLYADTAPPTYAERDELLSLVAGMQGALETHCRAIAALAGKIEARVSASAAEYEE